MVAGVGGGVGWGRESSVVWPMVSSQHCGNTPTPWLTQEALIKLSGQLKQNPEEEELKRGVGAGGKIKTQTKQPGGLSHSSADMLTHFILLRGPSHLASTPPALTSTSGLMEGQRLCEARQFPSQPPEIDRFLPVAF